MEKKYILDSAYRIKAKYFFILFSSFFLISCIPKDSNAGYSFYDDTQNEYYNNSNTNNDNNNDDDEVDSQNSYTDSSSSASSNSRANNDYSKGKIINTLGMHKATMRKYCIDDICYTPSVISIGHKVRGVASWYGKKFHGRKTSNGETYDMYGLSAAHKTFPMNTIVRVTNVDNGSNIILRINDRGPFVDDRIIDLSYGAALKLNYAKKGLINVELEVLGFNGDINSNLSFKHTPNNNDDIQRKSILNNLALQIGAFSDKNNAINLATSYQDSNYKIKVFSSNNADGIAIHRVRILGFKSYQEIEDYKAKYNLTNSIIVGD